MLSPLHVPMNVAAPCGIPRGLAGGNTDKVTRKSNCLALLFPWFCPRLHILQEAFPDPARSPFCLTTSEGSSCPWLNWAVY